MRENKTSKFTMLLYGNILPSGVFKGVYNIHIQNRSPEKRVICLVLGPYTLGKLKTVHFLTCDVSIIAGFQWF